MRAATRLASLIQKYTREKIVIDFPDKGNSYTFIRIDRSDPLEQLLTEVHANETAYSRL